MECVNRQISVPVKLVGKEFVAKLVCFCRAAYMEIAQLNLNVIVTQAGLERTVINVS